MKTSKRGIELVKKYEGLRLNAYKCPSGVWTIGYGHTAGVTANTPPITAEQAERYLQSDLGRFESAVASYDGKYSWTQEEFDALVSFAFNCGSGNLKKLLKDGTRKKAQIADAMPLYCKGGGVYLPGLARRRTEERALFLSAPTTPTVAPTATEYYPAYTGSSQAIDAVFAAIGADKDYDNSQSTKYKRRAPIARANGISEYKGTAAQNVKLVGLARAGELRRV